MASVLGALVLWVAYQGWLAFILLMALLWFPLLNLAISLPAMLTFRLESRSPAPVTMGTYLPVPLEAQCRFPMPPYRCYADVAHALTGKTWRQKQSTPLFGAHCGQLVCQAVKGRVYDYLGLFWLPVKCKEAGCVTVMPREVAVPQPAGLQRQISSRWKPKPGGGFGENHEIRLYRPGDSLNQLHWKLTAKTGKLMVREPMVPVERRLAVRLELRGTPEQLDNKMGKLLWLGKYLLDKQQHFWVYTLSGAGPVGFSVKSTGDMQAAMLALLAMEPAPDEENLPPIASAWEYHIGGEADE